MPVNTCFPPDRGRRLPGFIGNQYAPYYTARDALLIKAGYADDPRIEKAFQWLLSMRQTTAAGSSAVPAGWASRI